MIVQIVGRSSSLFTRMPLIFAAELDVPHDLVPILDMTELGPEVYAGNPALKLPILRNAQELVWHCMATQVQLIMGTVVGKLPADNLYFVKARAGLENSLHWLDANLAAALSALPTPHDLSVFEVSLFCLVDHLAFRATVPVEPYPSLLSFAKEFATKPSAQGTVYRFDTPPGRV